MIRSLRYSLIGIIVEDVLRHAKLPVVLMLSILISSVSVVLITHNTRLLTEQREQLIVEKDKLNVDWRNLILEDNVLGDHSRIGSLASKKLKMNYVLLGQEKIVVIKQ